MATTNMPDFIYFCPLSLRTLSFLSVRIRQGKIWTALSGGMAPDIEFAHDLQLRTVF